MSIYFSTTEAFLKYLLVKSRQHNIVKRRSDSFESGQKEIYNVIYGTGNYR